MHFLEPTDDGLGATAGTVARSHLSLTQALALAEREGVVSKQLSHGKTRITLDICAHVLREMQDYAAGAINRALTEYVEQVSPGIPLANG